MFDKVISTIEHNELLNNGKTVIVALSGGADSMALISIFVRLKEQYNIKLCAAHVNHGLRGEESDRDENFVRAYCKKNSIQLFVLKTDISLLASSSGEGEEQCGRKVRYEFFKSLEENAIVATAHTLSDKIETMIFNLARGSALKGLCGIPVIRDDIIRPLIDCTRCEVEEYCKVNEIKYVNDSTNTNDQYTRNHIRINIIPQLGRINPRYQEAFLRCSESLSNDEDLLTGLSEKLLDDISIDSGYRTDGLLKAHPALRKRALLKILHKQMDIAPDYKHIEALDLLLHSGRKLQVQNLLMSEIDNGILKFYHLSGDHNKWCFALSEGNYPINDKTINIDIVHRIDLVKIQKIHTNILDNCLDYDKIIGNSVIRSRCDGDKIRISKRNCTKTLRKLFNEASIPVFERNNIAVIADDAGPVWVETFGVAERCEITDVTKRVLMISIRRN